MRQHTYTAIAVAALVLCAGTVLASGEELNQSDPLSGGDSGANAVEVQFPHEFEYVCGGTSDSPLMCPSVGEAQQAGFLREMRIRRWLQEQRERQQMEDFYCDSGPAIKAALRFFWNVEAECPEPATTTPTCRYASRVADPC